MFDTLNEKMQKVHYVNLPFSEQLFYVFREFVRKFRHFEMKKGLYLYSTTIPEDTSRCCS